MPRRFQFSLTTIFCLMAAVGFFIAAERTNIPGAFAMRVTGWAVLAGAVANGFMRQREE